MKIQKIKDDLNNVPSGVLFSPEGSENVYILNYSNHCESLDYSPYLNHECNSCEFCYNKIAGLNQSRQYFSKKIFSGKYVSKINNHITVGKYHDIFRNNYMINNVNMFLVEALSTGHKVTAIITSNKINNTFLDICRKYNKNISIQIKVSYDNTLYGESFRNLFSKKLPPMEEFGDLILKLLNTGVSISIRIDPVILNVNSNMIPNIVNYFNKYGIHNYILKPLVSTHYFKNKILLISRRYASLLNDVHDNYCLYMSDTIFDNIASIICEIDKKNNITFCENNYLNNILGCTDNCCHINRENNE